MKPEHLVESNLGMSVFWQICAELGRFRDLPDVHRATWSGNFTTFSMARAGAGSGLMKGVVTKLNGEDFLSLAAYAASLTP